jgi:hypothetical protein
MPPRSGRRPFHKAHCSDEGVGNAGIVTDSSQAIQASEQAIWIPADELHRATNA